ncbi:hypothetical protein PPYR_05885 [Photinus pyralis]|uniref:Dual specificity protein phosphatase n=1 Tax=Photinus pyralis TaxID=7054 RepID=A0A1Y1NAF8_PHOPY|nr:dual specificity protein phosphatase 13-like [Photinus pyralis]KAB0801531.1 hypothetical protein PPYR_05885 [Photinus pyralis]
MTYHSQLTTNKMWRESVYSGTLRPKSTDGLTGSMLNDLLDSLSITVRDTTRSLSHIHSVNQISDGLFLGDKYAAKDKTFLIQNGFTHIVNAAEGIDEYQVNTCQRYYTPLKIKYLGIPGHDRPSWNISVYFKEAAMFIDNAVKSGGKVLVHCVVGISRSATLVIAYFMIYHNMNAAQALQHVFRRRRVFPNAGFLHHLAHLNSLLSIKRPSYTK